MHAILEFERAFSATVYKNNRYYISDVIFLQVGCHAKHENSRCFILERKDGTLEDLSYHKCVHRALQLIAPKRAENYESKWLQGSLTNRQAASVPSSWKSL